MSGKNKATAITAEEMSTRQTRARRKFKALARIVMANLFWMSDMDDNLGSNVRLNIQKMTRKKTKKSTLTTTDKIILMKPADERSEEEKRQIDIAIGGLKCFRKYPQEVKSQLAAVTYFVFIGPGRVIVRQDHAPTAMYFMLSGEAVVTVKEWDKLGKEWVDHDAGTVGPGTMLGEVALLHGISRTATLTTTQPCELLKIKKEDFDVVLKATVLKAWEQTQKIMNRFSYFKNWDAVTKRECSIISRTKSYEPDEVIFGDDVGIPNYTYLVTKGTVYIVEQVTLQTIFVNGVRKYRLISAEESVEDIFGLKDEKTEELVNKFLQDMADHEDQFYEDEPSAAEIEQFKKRSRQLSAAFFQTIRGQQGRPRLSSFSYKRGKLETHFLKVCEMTAGAVFNIGENFFRRRVIAKTKAVCLLIPRYWLIKMNKDYIWSRVQQFLNKHIPNTTAIFKNYIEEQKFTRYRKDLVKHLLTQKMVANDNTIHNVPYSIRLREGTKYEL